MNKSDLQPMFDYHYWAHRRVWDCVMTLTDEQFEEDLLATGHETKVRNKDRGDGIAKS